MATGAVTDKTRVRKTEQAFEWAFGLGFVTIFAAKLGVLGQPPIVEGIVASAVGVVIMMLYVAHQKRDRSESEQPRLGDEVYYLGLLYTLTSLCAALVSLYLLDGGEQQTLEDRTDEMIGSFGIALLTTMAGIVMRMPLQRLGMEGQATIIRIPHTGTRIQREPGGGRVAPGGGRMEPGGGRVTPGGGRIEPGDGSVEIEGVTIDLERYAHELRRQLQTSTNAFASHANQAILQARTVHAHMDEMMQAFHDGLEEKAKAELESLEAIYKAIAAKAEEVMKRTETQQASVRSALEKLEAHVKSMDESIERIRTGSGETAENLESIGVQAKASTRALVKSEKAVTEGLSALAEATTAEKTYQEARTQFAKELSETLERQTQEWMGVQRRAGEVLKEMEQTGQALAGLGREARRTNSELIILPDGLRNASEAIERLTEMANASSEISDLKAQAKLVTEQFIGIAGAGKRQQETLDATVKKLQTLAEVAGGELEGHGKLKDAIAEIADVVATAGRYGESLKDTEREIQRINTGLKGMRSAMQDDGLKLAEVLKQAIIAFEEAKRGKDTKGSLLNRFFRPDQRP